MPAWIHDRAMKLKRKMEDTYGPDKAEQVAFAVATQQAHATGKSPKTFVSKETGHKERFGTPEGRHEAKAKFDKHKSEYKKTAGVDRTNEERLKVKRWKKLRSDVRSLGEFVGSHPAVQLGGDLVSGVRAGARKEFTMGQKKTAGAVIFGGFTDEMLKIARAKWRTVAERKKREQS